MLKLLKALILVVPVLILFIIVPQAGDGVKAGVYKELLTYADKTESKLAPEVICEWTIERAFPFAEGIDMEYGEQVHWIVLIAEPPQELSEYGEIKTIVILVFCYEKKSDLEGYSIIYKDETQEDYRINKDTNTYEAYDYEKRCFVNKKIKV